MTNIYKNWDIRMLRGIGLQVSRATAQIPQGASGNIFTVSSGNVIMTGLIGEVTTQMKAVATTIKVHFTPTAAGTGNLDLCIASADQTGAAVGTHYHLPAAVASALAVDDAALSGYLEVLNWMLLPPGALSIVCTGLNDTGRIKWDMFYIPLDSTSAVAAA